VHLFGQPADMVSIMDIAAQRGLSVIEDCAQSFGAAIAGRQTGSLGLAGCFSFFPSKNLGCYGDGGLVITDDAELYQSLCALRNHGRRTGGYYHEQIGYNSRLDEIQATILRVKLAHIEAFNRERRRVAATYKRLLARTPLVMPHEDGIGEHVYHQFTVLAPDGRRDGLMKALEAESIASAIYYRTPLHQQPAFSGARHGDLPVAERISEQCLSLPIYPELADDQIERIAKVITAAC
ncbi:MAG: DegT/DnrJ/EryC1/StrS family aminotransferase, partial [Wenzhouxiangella sp.]